MVKKQKWNTIISFFTLLSVTINTVIFTGCITPSPTNTGSVDTNIVIGMTSDISGFYPWIGIRDTPTLSVNVNLFNCLVDIDPLTFKLIPGLAESWNNPDGTTWRFFLRKGVQFHNGDFFTAEDVNFTIQYLKTLPYYSEELEALSDVKILDNYTIDLITKKPCPTLLYNLVSTFILSEKYMKTIEGTNETWPIGTGAYKLGEYSPGTSITIERFDQYWAGQPVVKTVIFKKINTSEELKNALMNREINIAGLAVEDVAEIQNTTGFIVKSVQTPGVIYLSFDFRINDSYGFKGMKNPVSDVRVRKAIYQAINVDTIIEKLLHGSANPASQFVTDLTFGYNPAITRFPYDIETAKELMRDAGYQAGFSIALDTLDTPRWVNISNEIARQLSEINITVLLHILPANEYYPKLYYKNTSLYITGIQPLDAESLIKLLLQTSNMQEGDGVWNYGNYSNTEIDRLCEELSYTMDTNTRGGYIQEIFSLATSDVAWVPLFSPKNYYGMTDNIDWTPCPSLYFFVKDISFT
jgi:peptide/nickel transport system substrate-binding protein